jgi:hypothetical protein
MTPSGLGHTARARVKARVERYSPEFLELMGKCHGSEAEFRNQEIGWSRSRAPTAIYSQINHDRSHRETPMSGCHSPRCTLELCLFDRSLYASCAPRGITKSKVVNEE